MTAVLDMLSPEELREKRSAALSSVIAAVGLTTIKIIVGVLTGSLGIMAEAAHSGLDLAAAFMTLVAIQISARPADRNHTYGHGKVENLAAMFETLLLLATCFWIIYKAVNRLLLKEVVVEVTFWSFAVMFISIIVDASRSRILYRAAKKYHSQALEADALHFSTDIWSSCVVILGLVCMKLSVWFPTLNFLRHADTLAALVVALIVVYICAALGRRTINALLDTAPDGIKENIIDAVEDLPGVIGCHHVRLRSVGSKYFIDIHVLMDGHQTLRDAHDLTEKIEDAIEKLLKNADVVIHPEPYLKKD